MKTVHPTNPHPRCGAAAPPLQKAGSTTAPLTPSQVRIANRRLDIAHRFDALAKRFQANGCVLSRREAAREMRVPLTTLGTVLNLWLPNRDRNALVPATPPGRPPLPAPASYSDDVIVALQQLAVERGGPCRAGRAFAKDDRCPLGLSRYIQRHRDIPTRLKKLIAYRRAPRPVRWAGPFCKVEGFLQEQAA